MDPPTHLEHICAQIGDVLDPLTVCCVGLPVEQIRPLITQTWRREFGGRGLSETALTDTAVALHHGWPWCEALWTTSW